ncbi:MAG: ABC transporter substrate-binding protein [Candidatus Sumerlaeota bacterium]|nr:ABC transporter substrate-binding protein [Candidatus Sumerlaeota bacterium]
MSNPTPRILTLGHSPDPDDAFMFYALVKGKIGTGALEFRHQLEDIETLNQRAVRGELDITAISVHAYAYVLDKYAMLPCGASMGERYGPMVVARAGIDRKELPRKTIAIPGTMTSAFLALRLAIGEFAHTVVPFDRIFDAVESGQADAGLIIHEGQLTYAARGLKKVLDLGEWWDDETGLPLPLGCNVIRKDLGPALMSRVNRLLQQSIRYALDHRADAVEHSLQWARDMGRDLAGRFVGMYVNDLTVDYGERGRRAVELFLRRGYEAGLLPKPVELEFVS